MKFFTGILPATAALVFVAADAQAATLLHRWSFDNANDSVGGANVSLVGTASFTGGQLELPGGAARTNYATVPVSGTLAANASITVEAWFTLDNLVNWSKTWMFGNPNAGAQPGLSYIDFTPRTGLTPAIPKIDFDTTTGTELNTAGGTNPALMASATEYYVATVYDAGTDTMSFYINGVLADSASMGGGNITQIGSTQNFLGAAVNFGDPDLDGRINEMRIWGGALTASQILQQNTLGPNSVVPEPGTAALGLLTGASLFLRRRRKQ
jgi:hypothetical protein